MSTRSSILTTSISVLLVVGSLVGLAMYGRSREHAPTSASPSPSANALPSPSPTVKGATSARAVDTITDNATSFDVYKLYVLINAYRKEQSLSPLRSHPSLEASAHMKLEDMINKKYYRHQDADNIPSWYLFKMAHYEYTSAGENLSFGLQSPWPVFEAWRASQEHNDQLLTPEYTDMGLAADCATFAQYPDGGCIIVLHLGTE